MKDILNKLNLTKNEFHLICDVLNGWYFRTDEERCKTYLEINVEDGIAYSAADKKWNVDSDVLLEKIKNFTYKNALELLVAVDEFWGKDESDYTSPLDSPINVLNRLN